MLVLALPTESTPNSIILAISSTLIGTTDNRHTLYSVSFNSGNVFLINEVISLYEDSITSSLASKAVLNGETI